MPGFINNLVTNIDVRGGKRGANEFNRVALGQQRLKEAGDGLNTTLTRQGGIATSIVGQYAALAGSLFTLSLSYNALSEAAQVGQALQGLSSLSAQAAQDGNILLESVKGITKQQIAISDAVRAINLAISSGFSTEQIEGLSEVSLRASKALGIDLQNAYGRVTRASAKLETELLDELGIYTKIIPASQAYARSIGTTVSELTEFQRRQAFVTGVITEGQRKFGSINTTVDTTAESFNRFATTLKDLGTNLGIIIGDFVGPILRELTNNVGLLAAGISLLFSSAVKRVVPTVRSIGNQVGQSMLRGITLGVKLPPGVASSSFSDLQDQFADLLPPISKRLATRLRQGIADGFGEQLTAYETKQYQTYLRNTASRLARESDRLNEILRVAGTNPEAEQRFNRVNDAIRVVRREITDVGTELDLNASKFQRYQLAASTAFSKVGGIINKVGGLIRTTLVFGPQAFALTALFSNAIGRGEDFNDVILDVRENLTELFSGRAQAGRGFVSSIIDKELKALEEINTELKELENFSFTRKVSVPLLSLVFGDIQVDSTRTKEQLSREISRSLSEIANDRSFLDDLFSKSSGYSALSGAIGGAAIGTFFGGPAGSAIGAGIGAIAGGVGNAVVSSIYESISDLDRQKVKDSLAGSGALDGFSEEVEKRFLTQLATIREAQDRALTAEGRAYYQLQEDILVSSSSYLRNTQEINKLTQITGQNSATIASNYDFAVNRFNTLLRTTTDVFGTTFNFSFFK